MVGAPSGVGVRVWRRIIALAINPGRVIDGGVEVNAPLRINGWGSIIMMLDYALTLYDARRRWAVYVSIAVRIRPEIGRDGWACEGEKGNGENG
jgi:hypothetical protein